MTIEIETPQGLKRGSSSYEVTARNRFGLDPSGTVREWTVEGQAVIVDLAPEKSVVALLKTVNLAGHDDLAFTSMSALDPLFNYDYVESAERIAGGDGIRSQALVDPSNYPLMVTFRNLEEPASIVRLAADNLAQEFGPGVHLKRVLVELTEEPVTRGIEQKLPWLPAVYQMLRGTSFHPEGIPVGDFKGLFSTQLPPQ
ncbi:MAG: hypothetical protein EBR34_09815 [Sphingomonadaceae bacterium]|nr:hypothetical protein [Sphingomonadaceae bacterium]